MTRFLAVLALFAAVPLRAAEPPGVPVGGVGIVSSDQKTVFVPAKGGGVEALDVASGKVLWANKDASRLAGASDKVVFAWVGDAKKPHTFRLVALKADDGRTLGKSDPIEMPDWATTEKVGGRSFRVAARADGDGAVVAWQAGAFYFGGAAPSEEILAAAKKDASAVVSVKFDTGKVTVAKDKAKDDDFKSGPAGAANDKLGDYEFRVEEQIPGFKPGEPSVTKVTFSVLKGGKTVWARELAGNPWSPPPP